MESEGGRSLDGLSPDWISPPGRFGLGLAWWCHVCDSHRCTAWFQNPLDGFPQIDSGDMRLHFREPGTSGFGDITLHGAIATRCWTGYLSDGHLVQQ